MCIGVRRGRPVVEYTTTYAIGEYRHHNYEFESLFQRSVLNEHYLIMLMLVTVIVNGFLLFPTPIKLTAMI
jgi:hypothetical protein